MDIEWNDAKRKQTLDERGLDFADFALVDWDHAITDIDDRKEYHEIRYVTVAPIHNRLCVIAWCFRGDVTRVISMRKANKREVKVYDNF
jgi:uncharacterized DUF497 family protein